MTLTKYDLIARERLPNRAMTDAETYLKRQTFKVERAAVFALLALYRAAYRDLALVLTSSLSRAEAEARVHERLAALRRDVLALIGASAASALLGGYYGKLWLIDVSTRASVPVNTGRLIAPADSGLLEQANVEMDALAVDIRRILVTATAAAGTALLLKRLKRVMGADSTSVAPHGNFNRVQVLARTGVQSAMNTGALSALRANGYLLDGYEWLTARDERVCPTCAPRDGKRYALDTFERPPIHPQCRCSLVPVLKDGTLADADAPLRMTFAEWAQTMGVLGSMMGFLKP